MAETGKEENTDSLYAILATSSLAAERVRVLKHGDTFAVFDAHGDIKPGGGGEEGLYHEGTRYLSCLLLGLDGQRPLYLSSTVRESNDQLVVDLTNPVLPLPDGGRLLQGMLHFSVTSFLWQATCYRRLRVRNYGREPVAASLVLHYAADYADIFEVRGLRRAQRGRLREPELRRDGLTLAYDGLDGVVRRTLLSFDPAPAAVSPSSARFELELPPQGETTLLVTAVCDRVGVTPPHLPMRRRQTALRFDQAQREAEAELENYRAWSCTLTTSNSQFNAWIDRSVADLFMLTTRTEAGLYPYAGVPWFCTPFGRDGVITALEWLWVRPSVARGVLAYLAATQAKELDPAIDAEPGKVLHEARGGEMAALKEIPFGRYYGSIDATPLFVLLAGAYYERTGDLDFLESIWPNVEAALKWIDAYGDRDGDGFVEYFRQSADGLVQQGWKDSGDSVFHASGELVTGPVALCEVQGYVYAAKRAGGMLARLMGRSRRAEELFTQAEGLRRRFEDAFWCEDLGTYALALDGDKRPCRVRASNAGHCLFAGIASSERARRVAQGLLSPEGYSGWGVRTLAAGEARYNPMSYHNGSVWPHDNALIAYGLSRYSLRAKALQVLSGFFEASVFLDLNRLPELFCGFPRRPGEGPTLYPVACAPQAWAAGAPFLFVQAALGLEINAPERRVSFSRPRLPPY
ncbi:MAG TPA: amylo-alpha-1,6-glucosidase, partial [Gemmataceae bacterium]